MEHIVQFAISIDDQFIERAAELLKDSFVRTKAYKEIMKNAISKS